MLCCKNLNTIKIEIQTAWNSLEKEINCEKSSGNYRVYTGNET